MNKQEQGNNQMLKKRPFFLGVSALCLFCVGIMYGWSIFKKPISEEFKWNASQMALNYTIMICSFCLASLAAGILNKRLGIRRLLLAGAVLSCGGLAGLATCEAGVPLTWLYLLHGVCFGTGVGISYNTLLSVGGTWYPDKKGVSAGIMMMCFGLSPMILGKIAAAIIANPAWGWRNTYYFLAFLILAALLFASITLKMPNSEEKEFLNRLCMNAGSAGKRRRGSEKESFGNREYTTPEMAKRPTFWIYYLYGLLNAAVGSTVISMSSDISLHLGAGADLAVTLVGIIAVFNGSGRILCGLSFDKFGRKVTMTLSSIVAMSGALLVTASVLMGSLALGVIGMGLAGISFGSSATIGSAFISEFYGTRNYSSNYGLSNSKLLFSSMFATISTALLERTGSYIYPFMFLAACAGISLVLNAFIRKP